MGAVALGGVQGEDMNNAKLYARDDALNGWDGVIQLAL